MSTSPRSLRFPCGPSVRFVLPVAALFFFSALPLSFSREEQEQGYSFEHWVIKAVAGREKIDVPYTAEWDIPGEWNRHEPGVPISVKFIRRGNSIYLGDALRQRSIRKPFAMVVGFYDEDREKGTAMIREVHYIDFDPEEWERWWGGILIEDLRKLDQGIHQGTIQEARDYARPEAARLRKLSAVFSINPKVNKDQRRIQCSIPYTVFRKVVLDGVAEPASGNPEPPVLFGTVFPRELSLGGRSLGENDRKQGGL